MSKFSLRLKELRNSKNLSQQKLADIIGISKSSINMYERGEREPGLEMLESIADFFNVDLDYLLGKSDIPNKVLSYSIFNNIDYSKYDIKPITRRAFPLLGEIACGKPMYAEENFETYIEASSDINADFCLTAKGDSMINARIFDGDIIFIRSQPDVDNGEIAAVIINDEATLKRVYKYENRIELRPENPTFPVLNYEGEELNNIKILGKAIAFQSLVK